MPGTIPFYFSFFLRYFHLKYLKSNEYGLFHTAVFIVVFPFLVACSKDASPTPEVLVNRSSVTIFEDDLTGVVYIPVELSAPPASTIKISFSTADSTGVKWEDYIPVDSFVTYNSGEVRKNIPVRIIPNSARTEDAIFKVLIKSAENVTLEPFIIPVTIINTDYARLVWSDEFDGTTLNSDSWTCELGNNNGWGNNELEVYTNSTDNVYLENGNLVIKAIKNENNGTYTSARITTMNKRTFTYGKVEIRAVLPEGKGIWPALWMLGNNISTVSWPKCGEIDIMELLGHQPEKVYGTVHYDKNGHQYTGSSYVLPSGKFSSGFHLFTLLWQPNHLKWFVDGNQFFEVNRQNVSAFPWDLPQFFIFNVAVGGNWPGNPDSTTIFPQAMIVDYIRIYQ